MASVSSLDQDMRNLRLSRYTPQAANEVRQWIEETLGHSIPSGDLLDALKDGVVLCELANLALPPPGIRFKKSTMPFMQMENISHFLKACEVAPLNMPAHDRFLTVDLFESKDPAQVLQCLGAFSRKAHAVNPSRFKTTIGAKKDTLARSGTGTISNGTPSWKPSTYGRPASPTKPSMGMPSSGRAMSPALTGGSTGSQNSANTSAGPVSSWSSKKDESSSSPAWNIHQYGYMGGASQGNQGISFGARRQITSQAPQVPSFAEKERQRKEKQAEEERSRQQAEEAEYKRRVEREAEEERERVEEERRWEEEARRQREEERERVAEQKRQWAEQERRWKADEEARHKEDAHLKAMMAKQPPNIPAWSRTVSGNILRGQSLSQYQQEQAKVDEKQVETPEQARVRELEKQLEEARERERQYHSEREERLRQEKERSRPSTATTERPQTAQSTSQSEASWTGDEREYLRKQWQSQQDAPREAARPKEVVQPEVAPSLPSRSLPQPTFNISEPEAEADDDQPPSLPIRTPQSKARVPSASPIPQLSNTDSAPASSPMGSTNRPLPTPEPKAYTPYTPSPTTTRTSNFLAKNTPPSDPSPRISSSREAGDTSLEQSALRDRRLASQTSTKAGGWASKSLLEREMERERERQREWESEQKATSERAGDPAAGVNAGQSWDVNQYGYMGGDNMNKGSGTGSGIAIGGRRQIIGPRPKP